MTIASARPLGSRLNLNTELDVKAIEWGCPTGGNWAYAWNQNWSNAFVSAQLQQMKNLGANCVKMVGEPAPASSYPDTATYRARRQYFLSVCRTLGLRVYWNLSDNPITYCTSGAIDPSVVANAAAYVQTLDQDGGDIIIGMDLFNEFNAGGGGIAGWSSTTATARQITEMQSIVTAMRAVTGIPLSASVVISNEGPSGMSQGGARGSFIALQKAVGFDFHDVHLYYQDQTYNPNGYVPQSNDMLQLENNPSFIGKYLIGEMGCGLTAGQALQTRWFNGIGDIARRPKSHGAVMFLLTDFESTTQYGMYAATDTSFSNPRLGMTVPFSTWASNI